MTDFILLRDRYEFWKDRYCRTQSQHDYVKCQHYLQEYIRFIENGKVSKETISRLGHTYNNKG
jgi:hypothetical protein